MEELKNPTGESYEPIRHNRFIFKHPLIPTYTVKSVCIFGNMLNVELYYLENLEIDTILRCKNEACDCALILLDYKGAILHSFKYDNYIAEDISFDKFDYEDNEPLKINILFKCSDK